MKLYQNHVSAPLRSLALSLMLLSLLPNQMRSAEPNVVVYGATPAGIAAAISAARDGEIVQLIEPTNRVGGLLTSGLSHTDIRTFESVTGIFLEFTQRVESFYRTKYGADSPQYKACERGIFGEPSINLKILHEMLAEHSNLSVVRKTRLESIEFANADETEVTQIFQEKRTLRTATFRTHDGASLRLSASIFIDATYEGDLMAAAGVPWRTGRESRGTYGESLAPETADDQLQAYNFRFTMTRDPGNRVQPVAPQGYRREDFLPVIAFLESGQIDHVFGYPTGCIFKAQEPALPNNKYDINDVSGGLVRLSLPGRNLEWPNGDASTRQRIFNDHLKDQVGLLYFLQNDDAVPESFREEARQWGWCRDEFVDTDNLPPQLYVREARRMVGQYIFTEADTEYAPNDSRCILHPDAIAIGDYGPNCHGTYHEGPRFGGKHTGEFYKPVAPYQIPYGIMVPKSIDNLLVVGAVSSSHIGYCAIRLEPIWTSIGQAAGHAARVARTKECSVQDIPLESLQARLHQLGSATTYVSDIMPDHEDFRMVQWWGLQGGLHGLAPTPNVYGQRGRNLHGQYFEAFPFHAAELDRTLDDNTLQRWNSILDRLGLQHSAEATASQTTRREYLLQAWQQHLHLEGTH